METIERFAEFDANGNLIINDPPPLKNKRVKILIAVIEEETDASGLTTENIIAETAFVTNSSTGGENPLFKKA
ncbi:MAG TPA: hypothetical protein VHB70_09260 [Parafilimonas sp.]|nr:hypothetical protein [Parafilimonas sp.]